MGILAVDALSDEEETDMQVSPSLRFLRGDAGYVLVATDVWDKMQ